MIDVKLKVGDLVAFKKYDDMTENERLGIRRCAFPEFGKVSEIHNKAKRFFIEGELVSFSTGTIDHIISSSNTDDIHAGDEVLIKATAEEVKGNYIWISRISKDEVVKVLKHKYERFVLQEDHYGMYVTDSMSLSLDKSKAKIYNSCNEANEEANDMRLSDWEVIPYDD